jgi:hypothetical protein
VLGINGDGALIVVKRAALGFYGQRKGQRLVRAGHVIFSLEAKFFELVAWAGH